jgi:HSP20 family protein
MYGLVPFNQKKLLNSNYDSYHTMFDDFFADSWPAMRNIANDTFKLDVEDKEGSYVISAELPGVKKDEVNLTLEDGKLCISIEREEEVDKSDKNYVHKERRYSSMQRSVYLADADINEVKAKLDEGVLTIEVGKQVSVSENKKIEIE